jgi:hypothetical protein
MPSDISDETAASLSSVDSDSVFFKKNDVVLVGKSLYQANAAITNKTSTYS